MAIVEPADLRNHVIQAGKRYFGEGADHILSLAMPQGSPTPTYRLVDVALPDWAGDIGVGSPPSLLVDSGCVVAGDGPAFERCDWIYAAQLYLDGWLERSVENKSGPIQSYAFRLKDEWSGAFDRAWVNRIFLFLRLLAARHHGRDEQELFGPRPQARFFLTHDVDALNKTIQIRLKSTVMSSVATMRHLMAGRWRQARERLVHACGFAVTNTDYWLFNHVCDLEREKGYNSLFLFADSTIDKSLVAWLLDPSYQACDPRVSKLMQGLEKDGWQIGVHPGFNTWSDADRLRRTMAEIEAGLGKPVSLCRQHWLRFSWKDTWRAQSEAGIRLDFTLGFNDRSGFRNGAALRFRPWDHVAGRQHPLEAVPTIIMDSHFYDYSFPRNPQQAMAPWIDEVIAVGGEASLLWHVHTMHEEIGWGSGYVALLNLLTQRRVTVAEARVDG